ncbi:uncharacterized protein LOC101459346 [Ceratitis capitata]|uniref:Clip domain-containing protein n=1 Tax=Ceratitis capitata TaxID=7213 RepID=W8C8L0_CERCA|nr:uncharacterized protein LOC101459346 [Ceratitis capitata]
MQYLLSLIFLSYLFIIQAGKLPEVVLYEGDECVTADYDGKCTLEKQCPHLEATMTRNGLYARDVGHCGYTVYEEIICCPTDTSQHPLSKKYFGENQVRRSITLIITTTTIIQAEKIGDDLIFSNFSRAINTQSIISI